MESACWTFDVHNRPYSNAAIRDIVKELSRSPTDADAVDTVLNNTSQGLEEVEALLKPTSPTGLAQGLNISEELEVNWRNPGIKVIDALVLNAIGGTACWMLASSVALALSPSTPTPSESLRNGAIATMALLTYLAIIEWLREILKEEPVLRFVKWVLWVVQCTVSSMRKLIHGIRGLSQGVTFAANLRNIALWGASQPWGPSHGPRMLHTWIDVVRHDIAECDIV